MNVLSIGNSFSCDAQRYLHQIARMDGVDLKCYNLYIGGCPLSTHYRNMLKNAKEYDLCVNGNVSGFYVSLEEALLNRNWDVVTIQQVSSLSGDYETYQPYLNELITFVRRMCPKAKIAIHQTWAYAPESPRFGTTLKFTNPNEMYIALKDAYSKAASDINADFIIPSGELFQNLLNNGVEKLHRDCHHASLGLGRYALGLLWYRMLTGNSVENNAFSDFDEEVSDIQIETAKKCVEEICNK